MSTKFLYLPNLATTDVTEIEKPWDVVLSDEVQALSTEDYKRRWRNPDTKHWLLLLAEGRVADQVVSVLNPAAVLYGFAADYDGTVTPDLYEALRTKKGPTKYRPAWWSTSHSGKLHLFWLFDRPVSVVNNKHAMKLMHIVAAKIKAAMWAAGYDPTCEKPTQVIDIGREWKPVDESARIPADEVIMWDVKLFEREAQFLVDERVDIPFDVAIDELRKRSWPHPLPATITEGTRCLRFWDPDADNTTGAQFTSAGVRVYTPHDNGFVSWKFLLGKDFCDEYTAHSMAPFYEDTFYFPAKDVYWRFLRYDEHPHFEPRLEKSLRRDMVMEAKVSTRSPKDGLSPIEEVLKNIGDRHAVKYVAPLLYERTGRVFSPALGDYVLNISTVVPKAPAPPTPADPIEVAQLTEKGVFQYRDDPFLRRWDNPFAVRDFPHIHRLLTAFFSRPSAYRKWTVEKDGDPLCVHDALEGQGQLYYLISWLAHFYNGACSTMKGKGQVLFLAGDTGLGKSFFVQQIVGGLMGGADDAAKFYVENSRFSSTLAKKPVHYIDDRLGSLAKRNRFAFTERLKTLAANSLLRYEEKFGSSVEALPWPGRLVVLSNLDRQSLSVLPDLEMSTRDKFMMLKMMGARFEFGTEAENAKWLAEELPHFAWFLRRWETPGVMMDARFGVAAYQHPDLARASAENGVTLIVADAILDRIEEDRALADPKGSESDRGGWAFEGRLVKMYQWLTEKNPSNIRDFDKQDLMNCLDAFLRSGAYNLDYDTVTRVWRIAYDFRKPA
jgi:hypothetical protein